MMKNVNWKVRFTKKNTAFLVRFAAALLVPVLAYMGLSYEDITSWGTLGAVLVDFVKNPFLIGLTLVNALNLIPDPTTKGLSDSQQAMYYKEPK